MSVRREVVFVVGRGGSNAYVRKKRIVVGEKLLLDSTDSEIEGLIGHELGHISKNHLRKKAITTRAMMALAIVAVFLSSFWRELPIVLGTVLSFVSVISIPLNWKYEYEADAMAAETLGEEVVILALTKLQTKSFDGISLTHPPLSWRIRRVKAGLHQKENSSCP